MITHILGAPLLFLAVSIDKAEYSVLSVEEQGHCCVFGGVYSWCKILGGVKDDEVCISGPVRLGLLDGGVR